MSLGAGRGLESVGDDLFQLLLFLRQQKADEGRRKEEQAIRERERAEDIGFRDRDFKFREDEAAGDRQSRDQSEARQMRQFLGPQDEISEDEFNYFSSHGVPTQGNLPSKQFTPSTQPTMDDPFAGMNQPVEKVEKGKFSLPPTFLENRQIESDRLAGEDRKRANEQFTRTEGVRSGLNPEQQRFYDLGQDPFQNEKREDEQKFQENLARIRGANSGGDSSLTTELRGLTLQKEMLMAQKPEQSLGEEAADYQARLNEWVVKMVTLEQAIQKATGVDKFLSGPPSDVYGPPTPPGWKPPSDAEGPPDVLASNGPSFMEGIGQKAKGIGQSVMGANDYAQNKLIDLFLSGANKGKDILSGATTSYLNSYCPPGTPANVVCSKDGQRKTMNRR